MAGTEEYAGPLNRFHGVQELTILSVNEASLGRPFMSVGLGEALALAEQVADRSEAKARPTPG